MQAIQKLLDIARDKKNIEKRERITKNEKMSNNNYKHFFIIFTFLHKQFIFYSKIYLEKLSYFYICITDFLRGRLLEMQE